MLKIIYFVNVQYVINKKKKRKRFIDKTSKRFSRMVENKND